VILLEDISAAQNVNVDITAFGASEATVIKTFDAEDGFDVDDNEWNCGEGDYNTHLAVLGEGDGGIDTLTVRAYRDYYGEVSAASEVSVVVDDTWAVAGEGEGADLTIDASDVVTEDFVGFAGLLLGEGEGGIGALFINATQETDARLHITGSTQSSNILLGGARADTIIGGEGSDILYGGVGVGEANERRYFVRLLDDGFNGEETAAIEIDLDGPGGEAAITLSLDNNSGEAGTEQDYLDAIASFWSEVFDTEGPGVVSYEGEGIFSIDLGEGRPDFTLAAHQGGEVLGAMDLYTLLTEAGITVSGETIDDVEYMVFESSTNWDFTVTPSGNFEGESGTGLGGAADVLEGGAGDDLYVIAYSQLDPEQMTTIVGLDLGGVGEDEGADRINLGTLFAIGDYDASDLHCGLYSILNTDNTFHLGQGGEDGQGIVNNGLPIDITNTGLTLQDAVNELFAANGVFQSTSDAAINSAGLFTYGEDTYLIAVGEDAEGGFGADDFIVKVTGYTGTLDASDFADLYSYVPVP
jgi:hypothetical protein